MQTINGFLAGMVLAMIAATASAGEPQSCEALAVSKDGATLSGAARDASINKCINERIATCRGNAIGKNGKQLAGAAQTAFMDRCNTDNGVRAYCESNALSKDGKPLSGAAKNAVVKKCMSGS